MRYPSPADDQRFGTCPACEAVSRPAADYPLAHVPPAEPWGSAPPHQLVAVLDNIRSALNVGTILRTADGVGVVHAHLCGLTPAASNPKVIKTALGAENTVASTVWPNALSCLARLAENGFAIWALETTPGSEPVTAIEAHCLPDRLAVIVGNERAGVDPALLTLADRHLHLNMTGTKTSLNVGVAFGALIYAIRTAQSRNG